MHRPSRIWFVITLFVAAHAFAATNPPAAPLTEKERAQGYRDTRVLAKPRNESRTSTERQEAAEGIHVRERFARLDDIRVIEIPAGESVAAAIKRLRSTGRYEFVEPDYVMRTYATTPNDTFFSTQWALHNDGHVSGYTAGADISAPAAWDIIHDAANVIVAAIDGGIRVDHPELVPNLWVNPSPTIGDTNGICIVDGVRSANISDTDGHGTHVAGIICAAGDNGAVMAGVAWRTQLMVLKNTNANGYSFASDSAACIDYAVAHGAKIINCSFGGPNYSQTLYTALRSARDAGVIVVCAAGNDASNNDLTPQYPANYLLDNVLSVGNSTPADTLSTTSNYGNIVDLVAPGTSIPSLSHTNTGTVVAQSGTSMATPHVTGALVLLKAYFPTDTHRQLINRLLRGTDTEVAFAGYSHTAGRLNLFQALAATSRPFNDDFSWRAIITGSKFNIRANNVGATTEPGEQGHTSLGGRSLWWQWIAPFNGKVVIDTSGSDVDTVIDVYTRTGPTATLGTLSGIAASDDDGGAQTSRVSFDVVKDQSYYIAVCSKGGAEGFIELNVAMPPVNDNFADATLLTGESTQATAINFSATSETGEPTVLDVTASGSLWYQWVAPRSGRFQISAFSYDFDTLLAVHTGSTIDHLTLVAANDDTDSADGLHNTDSRCTIDAAAGVTYYIQVGSRTSDARGEVITTITDSVWQLSSDSGPVTSPPAVAPDGTIYVGVSGTDGRVYAISPDGALQWTYQMNGSIDVASPVVGSDGTIYQGCYGGKVVALTPEGTARWTRDFGANNSMSASIALAADGTLYIHGKDGYLYALDPANGSSKWSRSVGTTNTFASAVVASDGTIYQGSDSGKCLYAINPDGTVKWQRDTGGDTYSTPALDADGNIYFATYSTSDVVSFTPAGDIRWTYTGVTGANGISSSPILGADGSTVYIGAVDGKLHAIDAATGAQRWTYLCGDSILACTPAIDANGVIYIGAYDGKLYAIDPNGTLKRTWDTAQRIRSSPAISGTTLYVGSSDGKLYAFDIGASAGAGPWPQYRYNARRLGRAVTDPLDVPGAPQNGTVAVGGSLTLRASATGQGPLTYQWLKNGTPIAGANLAYYTITGATIATAGSYSVVVTGPQGSVTSTANVDVGPLDYGRLTNLSIRAVAGYGEQTVIGGMTLDGGISGAKKTVLVRAMGPTLAAYGVDRTLPDPIIKIFDGGTVVANNDGWRGNAAIREACAAVAAFPFASETTRDAAMLSQLDVHGYTMHMTGETGTGVALTEIYDATPSSAFTTATPRLTNISARAQVGTGGDVLIAGFTIIGSNPIRLLIRAVGPTLAPMGVGGTLANPKLQLHTAGSNPQLISENNDWGGDPTLKEAADSVAAFPLPPDSKDAVLVATLQPGGYTATVSGVDGNTGVALIEVYELR